MTGVVAEDQEAKRVLQTLRLARNRLPQSTERYEVSTRVEVVNPLDPLVVAGAVEITPPDESSWGARGHWFVEHSPQGQEVGGYRRTVPGRLADPAVDAREDPPTLDYFVACEVIMYHVRHAGLIREIESSTARRTASHLAQAKRVALDGELPVARLVAAEIHR